MSTLLMAEDGSVLTVADTQVSTANYAVSLVNTGGTATAATQADAQDGNAVSKLKITEAPQRRPFARASIRTGCRTR